MGGGGRNPPDLPLNPSFLVLYGGLTLDNLLG